MQWFTETSIPRFTFNITRELPLLLIGSCFTQNIGSRLNYYKFPVIQNPFGIIYNPLSLKHAVKNLCTECEYSSSDLHFVNGRYYSYDHHSSFSNTSREKTLANINSVLNKAKTNLSKIPVAFISLGTAYYWLLKEERRVVNNCHKMPRGLFEQKRASVQQIRTALSETIVLLKRVNPLMQIVFTLSPIRHLRHGSIENQLSKASLLVAIQELVGALEDVHYFPSYELLLDDLRDYRFYEEDLIHPNKQAINYIWEKFSASLIDEKTKESFKKIGALRKLLGHRPFNIDSQNIEKHVLKMNALAEELFPINISFRSEIDAWCDLNC